MTRYLHCLSLLVRTDRDLARADGWSPRFTPFSEGLILNSPERLAQCAWALDRTGGAPNVAAQIADAARADAAYLAQRLESETRHLPGLRDECLFAPPFAGLDAQKRDDIWKALIGGEDLCRLLSACDPALATREHVAALERAVRHLRSLAQARSLEAVYRELADNPLGLRLPGLVRVLGPGELAGVRWSPVLRTVGTFMLERGVEVEVARTVAGVMVVGRRRADIFLAEDGNGFAALEYVQVDHGLWDRAFHEYGDDAPRQRALAAHLERAVDDVIDGSPVSALRHFDEVDKLDPDHFEAALGRVEALLIMNSPQAQPAAVRVLSVAPHEPKALFLHALALRADGQADASTCALESALRAIEARMSGPLFGDPTFWIPSDLLLRAQILFEAGQLDAARAGFEAVLVTKTETVGALLGLGRVCLKMEQYGLALQAFEDALSRRPGLSQARQGVAQALLALGEHERAIEAFFSLAQWFFGKGWHGGAIACHEQILALDPEHTPALAGAGFALDRLQREDEAAEYFRRAAEIYFGQGRYSEAVSHCDYALARNRQLVWAQLCRGVCQIKLGDRAEGLSNLNAVLRIDPENIEALIAKAEVHVANWEYGAAGECLDQVLEKHPTHAGALLGAGQLGLLNADYTMAAMHFSSVLREVPEHVGAQLGLAECQLARGDFVEALKGFTQVLGREPENARALSGRIQALRGLPPEVAGIGPLLEAAEYLAKRERWQEAVALYSAAAAQSPGNTKAWTGIAQVQMKLGDFSAALASFLKLRVLGGEDDGSKLGLGQTLLALGEHRRALEVFESLGGPGSDRLEVLIGKARALEGLGHWNDALGCFAGALQIDEQNIEGYLGKGRMHLALAELDAARRSFACALAIQPGNAAALQGQRKAADMELG